MDGWNEDKLSEVLDVCDEIQSLAYEIRCCVRGAYTGCNTYADLAEHIKQLASKLSTEGEGVADFEDEEEEKEGYEDEDF